jgi:hypothetical protein
MPRRDRALWSVYLWTDPIGGPGREASTDAVRFSPQLVLQRRAGVGGRWIAQVAAGEKGRACRLRSVSRVLQEVVHRHVRRCRECRRSAPRQLAPLARLFADALLAYWPSTLAAGRWRLTLALGGKRSVSPGREHVDRAMRNRGHISNGDLSTNSKQLYYILRE